MEKPLKPRARNSSNEGFALPLVVILGFILAIGGMTLIARSFGGLVGSVRQQKSREAREAAEIGLAITMEALNGGYGYLMINCYPNPGNPSTDESKPLFADNTTPFKNSCFNTGGWGVSNTDSGDRDDIAPEFPSSLCPGSRTGYPSLTKDLSNPTSRYRVNFYSFNGTEFYGGKGTLKVTGEALSSDKSQILATSTIQQTFNVITEPCGGFPGLMMIYDGDLGNNDILGLESGNVHCVECTVSGSPDQYGIYSDQQLEDAIGAKNGAEITGNITIGPLTFPPVPEFPKTDSNCIDSNCFSLADFNAARTADGKNTITIKPIAIGDSGHGQDHSSDGLTITAGSIEGALHVNKDENGNYIDAEVNGSTNDAIEDFCVVLGAGPEMITHCLIDTIDLSNSQQFTIVSNNGPVRLYFKGSTINASGKQGIAHIWDSGGNPPASRLGLFGVKENEKDEYLVHGTNPDYGICTENISNLSQPEQENKIQKIKLSGGSGFSNLFGYFPCGVTGINGGGGSVDTVNGTCTEAGDMNGAIWTAYWGYSQSNVAELCVPSDMLDQLRYYFGADFALSVRRYRAQGITDWRGFQGLSQ